MPEVGLSAVSQRLSGGRVSRALVDSVCHLHRFGGSATKLVQRGLLPPPRGRLHQGHAAGLCRLAMVVVQQAAEPLTPHDAARRNRQFTFRLKQPVAAPSWVRVHGYRTGVVPKLLGERAPAG